LIGACDISKQQKWIDEKNELEKQIAKSHRLETIGTMAGGIAHDFNNILMPIIGYSDMALSTIDNNDPMTEYFQQILKSANRARDLVSQVLTFSKKSEEQMGALHLKSFLSGILNEMSDKLPAQIKIQRKLDADCPDVLANAEQIKVLVTNLCNNAFEAMEEGGTLTVSLKQVTISEEMRALYPQLVASSYADLVFEDDGRVIDRDQNTDLKPLPNENELYRAKGLGLSVVHGIVMRHNGEMIVKSDAEKGSTIHVYLPIIHTDKTERANQKLAGGKEMVMVVDDEEAVGHILEHMLRRLGYQVSYFTNGNDALQDFQENGGKYDLILTDLSMPVMTGLELTMQIRQSSTTIPVIIITGFCETLDSSLQHDYGVQAILGKPILAHDLDKEIRHVLKKG